MAKGLGQLTTERTANVGGRGLKSKRGRGKMQQEKNIHRERFTWEKMMPRYPMMFLSGTK